MLFRHVIIKSMGRKKLSILGEEIFVMDEKTLLSGFDQIQLNLAEVSATVLSQKDAFMGYLKAHGDGQILLPNEIEEVIADYQKAIAPDNSDSSCNVDLSGHIFKRIAAMVNANQRALALMAPVYARERYFFSKHKRPDVTLSESQKKEIDAFWAPYTFAYKNNPETQLYFYAASGRFDPSYISFGLHYHYLKKFWNTPHKVAFMADKNDYDILFPDVKKPLTLFYRIDQTYYDGEMRPISEDEAYDKCVNAFSKKGYELVFKPAREGEGRGIVFVRKDNSLEECKKKLRNVFSGISNYVCQRLVKNHPTWMSYPGCNALNVARINTMNFNGQAKIMTSYMKIAVCDMDAVNVSLGALCLKITEEGRFDNKALVFYTGEWLDKLPNGAEFAGRQLHNYDKVKETVLMMANRLPELKAIAWDITVDDEGDVLFIELNPSGGTEGVQLLGMHPYGGKDKMREILDEYLIKKFYYERADWDWDYWEFKNSISIHRYNGLKKDVVIPRTLRGKRVTAIHSRAFEGQSLNKIVVPDTVSSIAPNAFAGCGTDCKIILPEQLRAN